MTASTENGDQGLRKLPPRPCWTGELSGLRR